MKYSNSPTRYAASLIDIVADENSSAEVSLKAGTKLAQTLVDNLGTTSVSRFDVIPQPVLDGAYLEVQTAYAGFNSKDPERTKIEQTIGDLYHWDGTGVALNYKERDITGGSWECKGIETLQQRPATPRHTTLNL